MTFRCVVVSRICCGGELGSNDVLVYWLLLLIVLGVPLYICLSQVFAGLVDSRACFFCQSCNSFPGRLVALVVADLLWVLPFGGYQRDIEVADLLLWQQMISWEGFRHLGLHSSN